MCQQYDTLYEPLTNFTRASDAITCAYASDAGLGLGLAVFSLMVFGFVGMGLTIRTQHPGPILVVGILSAGVVASRLPGPAAKIMALVLFFGLAGLGVYLYKRAQTSL